MKKPNVLERAIAFVSPSAALERALARNSLTYFGYDAANSGTLRGSSGGMSKNASSENPRMATDRIKLMWEARDLERNMPIIRCFLDRMEQYVAGNIRYQAQTGRPEWDSNIEAFLAGQFAVCDATNRLDFYSLAACAYRAWLRDGDVGLNRLRVGRIWKLQTVESDRIGDPNKVGASLDPNYVQGIYVDDYGAPIRYDVYARDRKSSTYRFEQSVPAGMFYHLFRPMRPDEYRGVSRLAPIIAQARDLYEMFTFERGAAKWAASHAGVIRVQDPHAKGAAGSAGAWDGQTVTGTPTENVTPNKLLRLRPNEDVTVFNTGNRPSGAFVAYIDTAIRDIAMGLNVPYGFFNMAGFGGATVRLEAQQLERTFARDRSTLERIVLEPFKNECLQLGSVTGHELLRGIPQEVLTRGRWQFGKHLTADTGYDTQANLSLLRNGIKTASQIAQEEGQDYEDVVRDLAKEAAMLRDAAAATGVPVEMLAVDRFPDATNQLAMAAEAQQPTPPTAQDLGEGAMATITDLQEKVATGVIPRDAALATIIGLYGITPELAGTLIPEVDATQKSDEDKPGTGEPQKE